MSNEDTQTTKGKAPTHIAYHVIEGGKKSYWNRIGAAWAHKDNAGFSIQLDCTPLDGRISLRLVSEEK